MEQGEISLHGPYPNPMFYPNCSGKQYIQAIVPCNDSLDVFRTKFISSDDEPSVGQIATGGFVRFFSSTFKDSHSFYCPIVASKHMDYLTIQAYFIMEVIMVFLDWKEEYSTGITEFDEQHKKLFKCIDNICVAVSNEEEQKAVRNVLVELLNYTRVHFRDEEVNLMMYDVPEFEEHRAEHDRLAREVTEFALSFTTAPQLAENVLAFLKKWILFHIFDRDQKYTEHLKDKDIIIWE